MTAAALPPRENLKLLFAHSAYDMKALFDAKREGINTIQAANYDDLKAKLPEVDVLVVSGLWKNELLQHAPRLKYLQSISAGTNQYDLETFKKRGIVLASAQGVNRNAVSEHAIGLLLSLTRRLALARDNQHQRYWRPDQRNPADRESELPGKTLLLVGLGGIGGRIARLARAFDMHVVGVRRNVEAGPGEANEVHSFKEIMGLIPRADVVVLSCPLTDETRNLIDRQAIAAFKRTAFLINVARGACVDESALVDALEEGRIAGAALDVLQPEPPVKESKLWTLPTVILTPHSAGETTQYEQNVFSILTRNLEKIWKGDLNLVNRVA